MDQDCNYGKSFSISEFKILMDEYVANSPGPTPFLDLLETYKKVEVNPQETIRLKKEEIIKEIEIAEGLVEEAKAKWKALMRTCKHPDSYTYYAMGDPGIYCPDCGHQT